MSRGWWRRQHRDISLGWQLIRSHLMAGLLMFCLTSGAFTIALVTETQKFEAHRLGPLESTAPTPLQGGQPGAFQLGPLTALERQAVPLLVRVICILAVGLTSAVLIAWWLGRRVTRPLGEIVAITKALTAGDYIRPMVPTGVTEIDELCIRFNQMAERLANSFDKLKGERDLARRFASDAAYELRAPLNILKAYSDRFRSTSPVERGAAVAAVMRQVQQFEHSVSMLLQLTTLSEVHIQLERADLRAEVDRLAPICETVASQCGLRFHYEPSNSFMPVKLDSRLLELIVTRLVGRTCHVAAGTGVVTLSLDCTEQEAVIAVGHTGAPAVPGGRPFPMGERPPEAVFAGDHWLSIVRRAADQLGARLETRSQEGIGSRFIIYLRLLD